MLSKRIRLTFTIFFGFSIILISALVMQRIIAQPITNGAPPYGEAESTVPDIDPLAPFRNWQRPAGPAKVALQVGHWQNDAVPEELEKLKGNTGASGGGTTEVAVNMEIARLTAAILQQHGIIVEILPATVPPDYWADAFVAIHADGSTDTDASGFKIAAPWRDLSGKAADLVTLLEIEYQLATGLDIDPNVTRNMRGYYAFAWWRYEHSIHPMTTAVIVETGFLTNPHDRKLIVDNPHVSAQALAAGITRFLGNQGLI